MIFSFFSFFLFYPHFNMAGLLLLWNLRSVCYQEKNHPLLPPAHPLLSRLLACKSLHVCLTNHRRESCSGHSSSWKAFWNERFKTHLFWVIPTLRETNKNQNSSAVVCWNIWTLFPACDIIFLPDSNVKNNPENPLNRCLLKTQCGLYVCLPLWRNALWHEMCCQSAPLAWQMLRGATN